MDFYDKPSPGEVLEHHGIIGMKWGVRRYQNKDGSLTPAGKKRREQADIGKKQQEQAENASSHFMAAKTIKSAKTAVTTGASALVIASVGSIATRELARHGKTETANMAYRMSKKAFSAAAFATQVHAGSAFLHALMTSKTSMKDYIDEERRIKEKYK